jgi:hypothetical protein
VKNKHCIRFDPASAIAVARPQAHQMRLLEFVANQFASSLFVEDYHEHGYEAGESLQESGCSRDDAPVAHGIAKLESSAIADRGPAVRIDDDDG